MNRQRKQMSLGAFLFSFGHHFAAWRHPLTDADGVIDLNFYKRNAQAAERGKMDMIFFADALSLPDKEDVAHDVSSVYPDASTVISALAGVTERIGLAATVSTTFNEPYNIARRFATLDHLTGGRTAWNVVTSTKNTEARNFGAEELPDHGDRYGRAHDFLHAVNSLWDSWEDGALVFDKESGQFADTARIHATQHNGLYFRVQGPLNIPRSPQGRPVIVEAGTSEAGQRLAAQTADVVFTACAELGQAQQFYAKLKAQLPAFDRQPDELKVMPGVMFFLGDTEEEARALEAEFHELIVPEASTSYLSRLLNYDLSAYPVDGPLPDIPVQGNSSRALMVIEKAKRDSLSIRELGLYFSVARGHLTVTGTAEQIADKLQEWFEGGACDGFNIMPPYLPGGLEQFVDRVIPLLQARGLFRTEYAGSTLRGHLGLSRPAGRYSLLEASGQST
ncbi:FMN-dependent monooxygenase [Paenibacillus pinisoli]|uniref:FMN-dependent monooxygenase n=1 Tax=Paenibacillus pinisoli TaxID=1276110 RepID=A0A3A6PHL9_9BACL|nr:LLM class flavin-dependent oxidoreductase [Paenibacillus pinisoli]RJX39226.1 FMN-dependent monooxygenase [Paenibacillus pinisoli]